MDAYEKSGKQERAFGITAGRFMLLPPVEHLPRPYRGWTYSGYKPGDGGFASPVDGRLLLGEGDFDDDTDGMPYDGTVRITGTLRKIKATSDDVHLQVIRGRDPDPDDGERELVEEIVFTTSLAHASSGRVTLSEDLDVLVGDELRLFVAPDSPIDLRALVFEAGPRVAYLSATDASGAAMSMADSDGAPIFKEQLPFDLASYRLATSTRGSVTWPASATYQIRGFVVGAGQYAVTAKSGAALLGKRVVSSGEYFAFDVEASEGDRVFFSVTALDPKAQPLMVSMAAYETSDLQAKAFGIAAGTFTMRPPVKHLPRPYRGWTYSGYKPGDGGFANPVDGRLLLGEGDFDDDTDVVGPGEEAGGDADAGVDGGDASADDAGTNIGADAGADGGLSEPEGVLEQNPGFEGSVEDQRPSMRPVAEPEPCGHPNSGGEPDPEVTSFEAASPIGCERPDAPHWVGPEDGVFVTADGMGTSLLGPDVDAVFAGLEGGASGAGRGTIRLSKGHNNATGGGIGPLSVGIAGSGGAGLQDFFDMNGDGFPDIVTPDEVAYSMPHGGLGETKNPLGGAVVRDSGGRMVSVGGGASAPRSKPSGSGTQGAQTSRSAEGSQSTKNEPTFGFSVSGAGGSSSTDHDYVDVNGDGLPDRVWIEGEGDDRAVVASLNLGYAFASEPIRWEGAAGGVHVSTTAEVSLGVSAGYGNPDMSFGGGLTFSGSRSRVHSRLSNQKDIVFSEGSTLLDINGDGLVDAVKPVEREGNGGLEVRFNRGGSFGPVEFVPLGVAHPDVATSETLGQSLGGHFTVSVGPLCLVTCYLILNPGLNYTDSVSRPTTAVRDLDGDGRSDLVTSSSPNALSYARNQTDRTGLLRTVRRPLGAAFELDYAEVGNTEALPGSRWVLSSVKVFDGVFDTPAAKIDGVSVPQTDFRALRIAYDGGRYDRYEREFLGFSTVKVEELDTTGWDGAGSLSALPVYRRTTQHYTNAGLHDRGLLVSTRFEDGAGRVFARTENVYDFFIAGTTTSLWRKSGAPYAGQALPSNLLSGYPSVFPAVIEARQYHHEGDESAFIERRTEQEYDRYGNVTVLRDHGGLGAADDLVATIAYSSSSGSCRDAHVLSVPTSITVKSGVKLLRERVATVDCPTPAVSAVSVTTDEGVKSTTDLAYDTKGRLETITYPANDNAQRYHLTYAYDEVIGAHVTRTSDAFGFTSTAAYDYRFGLSKSDVDIHGESVSTAYDAHGRATSVTGPYQQGSGVATITYAYHPEASPTSPAWTQTSHHDVGRSDRIETATFVDGLGRTIQTKKDGSVHTGDETAVSEVMIVSGRVHYDAFGRVVATWHPQSEPTGTPGAFHAVVDAVAPTTITYDVLDRPLATTLPASARTEPASVGATTSQTYALVPGAAAEGLWSETTVVDATFATRTSRSDARGRIREVVEYGHPVADGTSTTTATTRYAYDAVGQLLRVTDARGNPTTVEYDLAGRRTHILSPDAGLTQLTYDAAGNVTTRLTATGQRIRYGYDFTHLVEVDHPGTEPDIRYQWGGTDASPHERGRIVRVDDAAGSVSRRYGPLGELVSETRVLAGRHPTPDVGLTTQWKYDTWGRLRQMSYPDGEVLTYSYDSGGLVASAAGVKLGVTYPYVDRLEYDRFGQRVFQEAGNGVRTTYAYDPATRRLGRLEAGEFQRLDYTYDLVGNVVALSNDIETPVPANGHGGRVEQRFTYDGLHRLQTATGTWTEPGGKTNRYSVDLDYDLIHNLTRKDQDHVVETRGGAEVVQRETTYDWAYTYGGAQPHAPSRVGDQHFTYDAAGRMVTRRQRGGRGAPTRTLLWDSEDRIRAISDGGDAVLDEDGNIVAGRGRTTEFVYDAEGMRVFKRGAQGETAYVNQFYTLRNGTTATKHVFVGASRISSKLVPGKAHALVSESDEVSHFLGRWWLHRSTSGWEHAQNVAMNPHYRVPTDIPSPMGLPESNFIYFYHPDHLGSSSFVTDGGGEVYEHVQYFPHGEIWADERSNTERLPYLFTGKELDQETGLYDFGARMYDPRIALWASPDPALPQFIDGEGGVSVLGFNQGRAPAGVFNPAQLDLYGYANGSPLRYIDPDGRDVLEAWRSFQGWLADLATWDGSEENYRRSTQSELGRVPSNTSLDITGSIVRATPSVSGTLWLVFAGSLRTGPRSPSSVWQLNWADRGRRIEQALGANLPDNFPVIDRFVRGAATSIKSLDVRAKTYQNIRRLTQRVNHYVDDVAAFSGRTWRGVAVRGGDITSRGLDLAIPRGVATPAQRAALEAAAARAKQLGVNVRVIEF